VAVDEGVQKDSKTQRSKHVTKERSEELESRRTRYSSIKAEASDIITPHPGGRIYTWMEGLNVGRESPLFGAGYESFSWHANILAEIQHSFYGMQHLREGKLKPDWIHQTPHSIFFQLFVSGGIVGVYLWVLIIGYAVTVLIFDLVKNKRMLNTPFIASIISFHIYGIFQSMQYIPMIWLLIFLNLGYAMTINDDVLPIGVKRVFAFLTKISIVL
jgi:O-antigen ligase